MLSFFQFRPQLNFTLTHHQPMLKNLLQLRHWISREASSLVSGVLNCLPKPRVAVACAAALTATTAYSAPPVPVSYSIAGANYTQDFNTLVYTSGTAVNGGATATIGNAAGNPTTATAFNVTAYGADAPWLISDTTIGAGGKAFGSGLAGWYGSGSVKSQIAANEGSQSTGGLVSYGGLTSSNRSLGLLCSSSIGNAVFGLALKNDTGITLTRINLAYTAQMWRQGTLNKSLTFGYLIDNTAAASLPKAAATADTQAVGTTAVSALNGTGFALAGTTVAVNGNLPANQQAKSVVNLTIPNWAPNGILWLTWDMLVGGNGHGLSIDDLTFSATEVSSNANLASLVPSSGTLSPAFDAATTTYTANVANSVTSITMTPTTANAGATVQVRVNAGSFATVTSGSASGPLALIAGSNTVDVKVTAQDTTTVKTYTTTVTRALSSNANLNSLTLSTGALAPVFDSATTSYTTNVGNAISTLTVTPTVADNTATVQVRVNGGAYTTTTSGSPTAALSLSVGANPIDIKVIAQDASEKVYTATITRQASSDVDLANLVVSAGAIVPTFDAGTLAYSLAVPNTVTSTTVTPTSTSGTSTITVNGNTVTSGSASAPISLSIGTNTITVVVTAQDMITTRTTNVTIDVFVPAAITTQPVNQTIATGNTATLTAVVIGTPIPTLQWYEGTSGDTSAPILGANSNSYTTPVLTASTNYWLRASNVGGSVDSSTAAVNVTFPPSFTTQPASTTIVTGNSTTLTVVATGNPTPTLQWYRGAKGVTTDPVVGETSSSLNTGVLTTTTRYWAQATNSQGTADSNAATVNVTAPAAIVTQPADTTFVTGARVGLRVVASGAPNPTFQWYEGLTGDITKPINPSGTSAVLNTVPLTASASYWVRVTNSTGTVDSVTATVTPVPVPDYNSTSRDITVANTGTWNPAGVTVGTTQFVNLGLQGVGRLPATAIDPATGESLGSVSDMQITGFAKNADGSYTGSLQTLPDRGYNAGTVFSNYAARINAFNFTFTPYTASAPTTAQNQIALTFAGSTRFTYDNDANAATPAVFTTGLLASGNTSLFGTQVPAIVDPSTQSDGTVTNRLTLDSEGLVLDRRPGKAGSGWLGDEYGGYIYHFNSAKQIDGQLQLPQSLVPHALVDPLDPLNTATAINFKADPPLNGRRINQGMEGLTQSPDGTKLFGLLQSATIQDSGPGNLGRVNTRLVVYNVGSSDLPNTPVEQYVIQLPRIDTDVVAGVDRVGAQSSILALNNHQILILSRDGNGRGSAGSPVFKSILLAELDGATNIGASYDNEGDKISPAGTLLPAITPVSWKEALNLIGKLDLNISEVAKFGFNFNADAASDINSICEKWESLALVPANDPANPNDYFLFVGNDNDFLTGTVDPLDTAHKGKYLDSAGVIQSYGVGLENDTIVLAYRVRIIAPEVGAPVVATTFQETAVQLTLVGNSGDTFSIISPPAASQGTLSSVTGVKVTFTPATTFLGSVTFTYQSTDGINSLLHNATVTVNLAPDLTVYNGATVASPVIADGSSTPVNFAEITSAVTTVKTFTIQNTGSVDITGIAASILGDADYSITTPPAASLIPGATTTVVVTFTPSTPGAKTATLNIANSLTNAKNPYSFDLTGTAVEASTFHLDLATATISEDAGTVPVTVIRDGNTATPVSVFLATTNGTAISGTDYTAVNETVTFTSGETSKVVNVALTNRPGVRADRTFTATLTAAAAVAAGHALVSPTVETITITESETALAFGAATASVREDAGKVVLTVNRTGVTSSAVSAEVSTTNGTAISGTDYTGVSSVLVSFAANQTSKTINVPVINRAGYRPSRTFTASMANLIGAITATPSTQAVSITEADSAARLTGPSSSATPYLVPLQSGYQITSVLSVGDAVPLAGSTTGETYQMVGIPDGLGAYDNGDGTVTLLMHHELGSTLGAVRAHGAVGAFISEWIIDKSTLQVSSGSDLMKQIYGWNTTTQSSNSTTSTVAFTRFCSADLPAPTALYNPGTGKGSQVRILLGGEEGGATGYAVAHVASGPDKGKSYILGKFNLATNGSGINAVGAWENLMANPFPQDKTIVMGNNDGGTGIMAGTVNAYVGTKTLTGTEADKAGLTNGLLKFVSVAGNPLEIPPTNATTRVTNITSGTRFSLSSASGTVFSRPEDGAWNPVNPAQYYFVTTDRLDNVMDGLGTQVGRTRLWRLTFDDITNPDAGGVIEKLVEGGAGNDAIMFDNLCVTDDGKLMLQEDVGGAAHNGKIWFYDPATNNLQKVIGHDVSRFGNVVGGVVTPATAPFNNDEESSGIIDITSLMGGNAALGDRSYFTVDQAHYSIPGALVEGGQLLMIRQLAATQLAGSSASPYVQPVDPTIQTRSLLTVGDAVPLTGTTTGETYQMSGIPDGLGAYDNGNGTFTLLMNHELGSTVGVTRAHGAIGAFISEWVIDKSTLAVQSGSDLIKQVYGWNSTTQASDAAPGTYVLNRFCSADLPPTTAYYNATSGLGTQDRIYMAGEEGGSNGWAFANVASGPDKGKSYILGKFNLTTNGSATSVMAPVQATVSLASLTSPSVTLASVPVALAPGAQMLGATVLVINPTTKVVTLSGNANAAISTDTLVSYTLSGVGAWENLLANPHAQDLTVVAGCNDGGTGIMNGAITIYQGTKTNTGNAADKAGLNNGSLKFVKVTGIAAEIPTANATTRNTDITSGTRFTLETNVSTAFSRPEDGSWNPMNDREFFFVTTDRIDTVNDGVGTQVGRTRLWKLTFDDITNPDLGGTVDLILTGGVGNDAVMWDNMTITTDGKFLLQEDVGGAARNGKIWFYDPTTAVLKKLAKHDAARFGDIVGGVVVPATLPYNNDEETSGIIEVSSLLGAAPGERLYLFVDQAHYTTGIAPNLVEGGQLLFMRQQPLNTAVAPVATFASAVTIEESTTPVEVTLNATDANGDALTFSIVTPPSALQGTIGPVVGNKVMFTPTPNFSGVAEFTFKANDGALDSNLGTAFVAVLDINDTPTLDVIADVTVPKNTITPITLTGVSRGPVSENAQTLTITVVSDNTAVVPNSVVSYTTGTTAMLNLAPVAGATGTAVLTVTAMDNGGTTSGGIDTVVRTFTVNVITQSYSAWQAANFTPSEIADPTISGPAANPDGDARNNAFEYALGSQPKAFDATPVIRQSLVGTGTPVLRIAQGPGDADLSLETSASASSGFTTTAWTAENTTDRMVTDTDATVTAPRYARAKVLLAGETTPLYSEVYSTRAITAAPAVSTFASAPLREPRLAQVTVSALGAYTLTPYANVWPSDLLAAGPCYVMLTSGTNAGVTSDIVSFTAGVLTLSDDLTGIAIAGDGVEVRRHHTLTGLFDRANAGNLTPGLNSSVADLLQLVQPNGTTETFFRFTTGLAWMDNNFAASAQRVINPEQAFVIRNQSATALTLFQQGVVLAGVNSTPGSGPATIVPVETGTNLVTSPADRSVTIAQLGLYTGNPATGVASGVNASSADRLVIPQPNGTMKTYYYFSNGTVSMWVDSSSRPAGTISLPPGTPFYIVRKAPRAAFPWALP